MGCLVLIKFHNCSLLNYRISSTHRSLKVSSLSATLSATVLYGVTVSEECIDNAFAHLKRGKSDGTSTCSDHLIHALPAVRSSLAFLFTSILRHGYMPESLRNCVLVPIPKANKDPFLTTIGPSLLLQLWAKLLSGAFFFSFLNILQRLVYSLVSKQKCLQRFALGQ